MPRKPWKDLTPQQRLGYLKVVSEGDARIDLAKLELPSVERKFLPVAKFDYDKLHDN